MNKFQEGLVSFGLQQVANTVGGNTALKRQERLMGINLKNQKELNRQGRDIQMDMWNRTNYGAQVRHMKEAGLSPGLIYGNSGGGGATTGSQGGGNAASGGAPSRPQMGMEALMMGHQMDLMKAQARKLNAEANNEENGKKEKYAAEIKEIQASEAYKQQLKKTEVNNTEKANYEAITAKLEKEWGVKYELTKNDTIVIKTLKRLAQDGVDAGNDEGLSLMSIIEWVLKNNTSDQTNGDNENLNNDYVYDENGKLTLRKK